MRKAYADLLRQADAIFIEELRRHDLYDKTSQAFAVFLPVRWVSVMDDGRRYDYVVSLRAVATIDFVTALRVRLQSLLVRREARAAQAHGVAGGTAQFLQRIAIGGAETGVEQLVACLLHFGVQGLQHVGIHFHQHGLAA